MLYTSFCLIIKYPFCWQIQKLLRIHFALLRTPQSPAAAWGVPPPPPPSAPPRPRWPPRRLRQRPVPEPRRFGARTAGASAAREEATAPGRVEAHSLENAVYHFGLFVYGYLYKVSVYFLISMHHASLTTKRKQIIGKQQLDFLSH